MKARLLLMTASLTVLAMSSVKISAQWVQSSFPTSNQVTDMKFYGNVMYVTTYGAGIFQTQNFTAWSPINNGVSTSNIYEIITAIEGANITLYVATDAGVFRSAMLGFNWTAVNNGLTNLNVGTVYSDGAVLYAGTAGGAFRSANYGQSWTPMTVGTPSQVVSCFYKNGPDMLAGLIGAGQYLYRSTDQGLSWEPYGTGVYEIQQIESLDGELFAVSGTLIYFSTDNGATWNPVGPGLVPGMPVSDITTGDDHWWIATYAGGYVQHTDSTNFLMVTAGMPLGGTNLSAVAVNNNWFVFGSLDNGIWYQPAGIITTTDEYPDLSGVINCFPNPTSGKFQITNPKHQTNSNNQIQKIEVVDLYGKAMELRNTGTIGTVRNLEPGTRNLELDISNYPSGIYFLRISLENQTIVKKIIKI
jgi:photosystem II stability/assembly factor-like uncharacterized protein